MVTFAFFRQFLVLDLLFLIVLLGLLAYLIFLPTCHSAKLLCFTLEEEKIMTKLFFRNRVLLLVTKCAPSELTIKAPPKHT